MRRDDERGNLDNRRVALPRLRAQFDEFPEMDFFFVSGAAVIGALWSRDLGWLLATVMLAGIIGATLALEVNCKFRLTRSCYGWLAAYLRRALR